MSDSIQKQIDERESNPNNVVVLNPKIAHEYFEKHRKKKEYNTTDVTDINRTRSTSRVGWNVEWNRLDNNYTC